MTQLQETPSVKALLVNMGKAAVVDLLLEYGTYYRFGPFEMCPNLWPSEKRQFYIIADSRTYEPEHLIILRGEFQPKLWEITSLVTGQEIFTLLITRGKHKTLNNSIIADIVEPEIVTRGILGLGKPRIDWKLVKFLMDCGGYQFVKPE